MRLADINISDLKSIEIILRISERSNLHNGSLKDFYFISKAIKFSPFPIHQARMSVKFINTPHWTTFKKMHLIIYRSEPCKQTMR